MENAEEKNAETAAPPSEEAASNTDVETVSNTGVENKDNPQTPADKNEQEQITSLEEAEATLNGISESIENQFNLQDMETTEMKVKVICLEKNNIALKMELQCSELQLKAKTKVDAQKTRLVELLDGKVQSLQKKNTHLMEMFETLLKDKNAQSHRLMSATKIMEELSAKLTESERMRNELRSMNQELKMMLGNIEDKGTQIAKVAKEKILKYKAETLKVQQQMDSMQKDAPGLTISGEPGAANQQQTELFQQKWKKIDNLLQQLKAAFQGETTGCLAESMTSINTEIKQELEQMSTELNTLLNVKEEEGKRLRSSLNSIRLVVTDLKQLSQENLTSTESPENSGNKDTNATADKEQEISQLQERLSQFNAGISKLADLFASVPNK